MSIRVVMTMVTAALAVATAPAVRAQGAGTVTATFAAPGQPGAVVRLDVGCGCAATEAVATVFGRSVPLTATASGWQGLIGVDLDVKPGTYNVTISLRDGAQAPLQITRPLTVGKREFAVRRLRVAPAYVDPPQEVLKRIGDEAAVLQALYENWANPRQWEGAFQAPVSEPPTSSFGLRSVFNGQARSPHSGTDFSAGTGTPVAAPAAGIVVMARPLYYTGNTVVIDHGVGLYSVLAHLSEFTVTEAAQVGRGDIVGRVGATGRVTGPHLHWSVRLNGARVDPLLLLTATADPVPAK